MGTTLSCKVAVTLIGVFLNCTGLSIPVALTVVGFGTLGLIGNRLERRFARSVARDTTGTLKGSTPA